MKNLPTKTTHKGYDFLSWTGRVYHPGIDYNWGKTPTSDLGQDVCSIEDGVVVHTSKKYTGFGHQAVVEHVDGTYSRYAHLRSVGVVRGQRVVRGQFIGELGSTGASTSPHLHVEVFDYRVWRLGPDFYPVGKSKAWVSEHYQNPDEYIRNKPIKIKFLAVDEKDGELLEEYIESTLNWFYEQSDGQFRFQYEVEYLNDIEAITWRNGPKHRYIESYWAGQHLSARASGFDMVVIGLKKNRWDTNLLGFALTQQMLGVHVIGMEVDLQRKDTRKRGMNNDNQFSATLRHEIFHLLYTMQGDYYNGTDTHRTGRDNTHYFDYVEKDIKKAFAELKREDIRGWNVLGRFRLFATAPFKSNSKKAPDWIPTINKLYRSDDGRMYFQYKNTGWKIISEEEYRVLQESDVPRGTISAREANWIYAQLNMETPPMPAKRVVQRVVYPKNVKWWELYGFSDTIPRRHLM